MAKTTGHDQVRPVRSQQWVSVQLPADAGLQRLLTGSGTPHEGLLCEMATHADPGRDAQRTMTFPAEKAGAVAGELAAVLERAQAAGDEAAPSLAGVLGQLRQHPQFPG